MSCNSVIFLLCSGETEFLEINRLYSRTLGSETQESLVLNLYGRCIRTAPDRIDDLTNLSVWLSKDIALEPCRYGVVNAESEHPSWR